MQTVDVLIIGGGLVGVSCALALADHDLKVMLCDASPAVGAQDSNFDVRSIALSDASVNIFRTLNLWEKLRLYATPIQAIHVSEKGRFAVTRLDALKNGLDAYGYVVELANLNQILEDVLLRRSQIENLRPAKVIFERQSSQHVEVIVKTSSGDKKVAAKAVIAADGSNSVFAETLRLQREVSDYQQTAIVANIGVKRAHQSVAYERFTHDGLIAMLPMSQQRVAMIWALGHQRAAQLQELGDDEFLAELQQIFGYRLGRFTRCGQRQVFPLKLSTLKQSHHGRVVFIGNSSSTLHPIAGQGFNLGLRDAACAAELLSENHIDDVEEVWKQFQQQRRQDRKVTTTLSDLLVKSFSVHIPGAALVRGLALLGIDCLPLLKQQVAQRGMGYLPLNSKLASGITLGGESLG